MLHRQFDQDHGHSGNTASMKCGTGMALVLLLSALCPSHAASSNDLQFIDTGIENGSPVWYEFTPDGTVAVHLLYDHERSSPNRAAGHFHFVLHGTPGAKLTLEFKNLDNVWN